MKKNSLLFSAVAMVLVSLVAVTGVTFAWFSAARNPSVNQIDAKVTSSGSLLIATKYDGTFKPTLTFKEILDDNQHLEDISLNAVTPKAVNKIVAAAGGGIVTFASDMQFSEELFKEWYMEEEGILDPQELEQEPAKTLYEEALVAMKANPNVNEAGRFYAYDNAMPATFIDFTLYFRASEDMVIHLDLPSLESNVDGTFFNSKDNSKDGIAFNVNRTNTASQRDLQYSLRAGFVAGDPSSEGEITAGKEMTIYDPYLQKAAIQGDLLGNAGGGHVIEGLYDSPNYYKYSLAPVVEGVKRIPLGVCDKAEGLEPKVTAIRIYIWVEGNDLDNTSFVAGGNFVAGLRFYGELVNP